MKIEVIATYYREEYLASLFMLHYERWVDTVTLLTSRFPENKLDDALKLDLLHDAIARSTADWVIVVDFDEFVFPKTGPPRIVLEQEQGSVCNCEMLRVWRHASDQDVDHMQPPLLQRKHGAPDHVKPCIFRPHRDIRLDIGTHGINVPPHYKWGSPWSAVHWANADPEFGIERTHRDRQTRLSQNNLDHGWGIIPEWLDPKYLGDMYASHMNDPQVL